LQEGSGPHAAPSARGNFRPTDPGFMTCKLTCRPRRETSAVDGSGQTQTTPPRNAYGAVKVARSAPPVGNACGCRARLAL